MSKEELDQDVGLNLLQLLGSKYAMAGSDDKYGGVAGEADEAFASPGPSRATSQADEDDDREVVATSLVPAMEAVLATVNDWRFDAFKLAEVTQGHPLSALGFWLMKRFDIINTFQLDATRLARFLRKVEDGSPDNPYHNKVHAADVLQVCTLMGLSFQVLSSCVQE